MVKWNVKQLTRWLYVLDAAANRRFTLQLFWTAVSVYPCLAMAVSCICCMLPAVSYGIEADRFCTVHPSRFVIQYKIAMYTATFLGNVGHKQQD